MKRPMKAVRQIEKEVSAIDGVTFNVFNREQANQTLFHIMYKNDTSKGLIIGSVVYLKKSKLPRIQMRSSSYYSTPFDRSSMYYVRKDGSINTTKLVARVSRWAANCKIKEINYSLQNISYTAREDKTRVISQILREQLTKHGRLKFASPSYSNQPHLRLNKKGETVLDIDLEEYDEEDDPFIRISFNLLEIDLGEMVSIMCSLARSLAKKKEKVK